MNIQQELAHALISTRALTRKREGSGSRDHCVANLYSMELTMIMIKSIGTKYQKVSVCIGIGTEYKVSVSIKSIGIWILLYILFLYTWFLATLHGVCKCNVSHYVLQCIPIHGTMSFTPHKFIKIAFQLVGMATAHSFELYFHSVPVAFNVLSVNTCDGIHEVAGMIYRIMSSYRWKILGSGICCPHV